MIFLEMPTFGMVSKYLWSGMNVCVGIELIFPVGTERSYQRQLGFEDKRHRINWFS